jgi:curved DNA-binding protein CbpA
VAETDPFDELGVQSNASQEEIERAYRRRVVERHRQGVWRIATQLRRAQRALSALSDPDAREQLRRARQRAAAEDEAQRAVGQRRKLALLEGYKERMARDSRRIGSRNSARYAHALAELNAPKPVVLAKITVPREDLFVATQRLASALWSRLRSAFRRR